MEPDHVLIVVADLATAAEALDARYGLASAEGGRHQGLGTANRIAPLGNAYIELIAVVDEAEASSSGFGRWLTGGEIPRLLAWCIRTDDLDSVARRLELTVADGARARPDGTVLHWRMAGLDRAQAEPALPFFIEWGPEAPHPGRTPVRHLLENPYIEELRLEGNPGRLAHWLGGASLPVSIREGPPAIREVVLKAGEEQVVLDGSL